MISIIIPVYNEEDILRKNCHHFRELAISAQLIFVDGGSRDQTVTLARKYGEVFSCPKGRWRQMNRGASESTGSILVFLHADAVLPIENIDSLDEIMDKHGYIGGCFKQTIDCPGVIYKWIAFTGNLRARISKIFYGDQGIFVRKDIFEQVGGFPPVNLCEDVVFSKKLKNYGKTQILSLPIFCSARRWVRQGILKTFFLNMKINSALAAKSNLNGLSYIYEDIR